MKTISAVLLTPFLNLIELFDRLFRRPAPPQEVETMPVFENDNRELIKELTNHGGPSMVCEEKTKFKMIPHGNEIAFEVSDEFEPVFLNDAANHSPDVRAPKGVALRKSVQFRTRAGDYMSAKIVGWDGDGSLILSRKNGPWFRRHLTV